MSNKEDKSPITIKEEEIDFGKLFSMIGNMFSNLFKFLETILKGVFHYFILLLLFIKKNLKPLLIAIATGSVLGFSFDYIAPDEYTYDMIIEPNYGSIDQIFEKMEYYNVLIKSKDSATLSKEFDISYKDAKSLAKLELSAYETKKDQILAYDKFVKSTDTLTHEYFTFHDFVGEGTSKFDSKRYVYRIISYSPSLKLFSGKILADIESNPTIQKRKKIQLSTLKLDSIATRLALEEIDSLRSLYKRVTLLEVEKETPTGSSTYLDFSQETQKNNNDIELFKIASSLNDRLIEIEKDKETSEEIVNIITVFNPAGKNLVTVYETRMFLFGSLFGGVVMLFILLKELNTYLSRYKEQITH